MATIDGISTDLANPEFSEVLKALKGGEVTFLKGTVSVAISSAGGDFEYRGNRYRVTEQWEHVETLHRL